MEKYITYGHLLRKEKFNQVRNSREMCLLNKPVGGLWCSPVKSEWGWKDWCKAEDFHPECLKIWTVFRMKEDAKIFKIRTLKDWDELIMKYGMKGPWWSEGKVIDFEALTRDGYHGLFATADMVMKLRYDGRGTDNGLNAWDCESMIIFDYDQIEVLEEKEA